MYQITIDSFCKYVTIKVIIHVLYNTSYKVMVLVFYNL